MAEFPYHALLPKAETQAEDFLKVHPEYDGRGTVVAIFDTGVDPGAPHLQTTTDGKPKIIDIIDATGAGDVDTKTTATAVDGVLAGKTGRQLRVPKSWVNPSGVYHIGLKSAFELFPGSVVSRLKEERKKSRDKKQTELVTKLRADIAAWTASNPSPSLNDKRAKTELENQLSALLALDKGFVDYGPVYDCVVFHDGQVWRAAVDISEQGDLSAVPLLADYKKEFKFGTFSNVDQVNYSVNIYEDGNVLSIVCTNGAHGTHVAAIVGAHDPLNPSRNGVAPGCQLVSVMIGDTRISSMETGPGLIRGLIATVENKCDLINMSFGESSSLCNAGRFIDIANEVVNKHGVIFVSSAGNNGPALTTVGCPGGTTSSIIGVGAYVTQPMMQAEYSLRDMPSDTQFTWSSRGPCTDGDLGVSISAPGGAIADVPTWTLKSSQLMNGTSMSSPNACGCLALLLSGLKAQRVPFSPIRIKRALENTAKRNETLSPLDQGYGLVQILAAYEHVLAIKDAVVHDVTFTPAVLSRDGRYDRGMYLRDVGDFQKETFETTVRITPVFHEDTSPQAKLAFEVAFTMESTASWLTVPKHLLLMNEARAFNVEVDLKALPHGVHYGEILGYGVEGGPTPLFRVPFTIVKPVVLPAVNTLPTPSTISTTTSSSTSAPQSGFGSYSHISPCPSSSTFEKLEFRGLEYEPGHIKRLFVSVPTWASWAEASIVAHDYDGARRFAVHFTQLQALKSFDENNNLQHISLGGNEEWTDKVAVLSGSTLELALVQWWNSLGPAKVDVILTFDGLQTEKISFTGSEEFAESYVTCVHRKMIVAPSASLDTWRQVVRPSTSTISILNGSRNTLPSKKQVAELVLTYSFTQKEKGDVTPIVPNMSDILYESMFESQLWMVFDANKQLMGVGDAFPVAYKYSVSLPKGDYTLRLQIRHDDVDQLEKLKNKAVWLQRSLKDSLTLAVHSQSPIAGGSGGPKASSVTLASSKPTPLYVRPPSVESLAAFSAGDLLLGNLSLVKDIPAKSKVGKTPIVFHVVAPVIVPPPPAPVSTPSKPTPTYAEALRDHKIAWLPKVPVDQFEALYKELSDAFPAHLPLHVAAMNAALSAHKKKANHFAVVGAAQRVIKLVDTSALAEHYGRNLDPFNAEAAELRSTMDATKASLISALATKAQMLVDLINAASKAPHITLEASDPLNDSLSSVKAKERIRAMSPITMRKKAQQKRASRSSLGTSSLSPTRGEDETTVASNEVLEKESPAEGVEVKKSADEDDDPSTAAKFRPSSPTMAAHLVDANLLEETETDGYLLLLGETMAELMKWTDVATHKETSALYIQYETISGRYGGALSLLLKQLEADISRQGVDLKFAALKQLGWAHLVQQEEFLLKFPADFPLF